MKKQSLMKQAGMPRLSRVVGTVSFAMIPESDQACGAHTRDSDWAIKWMRRRK